MKPHLAIVPLLAALIGCTSHPKHISLDELERLYPDHVRRDKEMGRVDIRAEFQTVPELLYSTEWTPPSSPILVGNIQGLPSEPAHHASFILDTGASFVVQLDVGAAQRCGVPLAREISQQFAWTAGGSRPAGIGLAASLQLPGLRIAPAPVVLNYDSQRAPMLGQPFVEHIGGLILNPHANQLIILQAELAEIARSRFAAYSSDNNHWVELPWTRSRKNGLRTTPVHLGGREIPAILDTGSHGGLFIISPNVFFHGEHFQEQEQIVTVSVHGVPTRMIEFRVDGVFALGPIQIRNPLAHRLPASDRSTEWAPSANLVVGMDILALAPIWFDAPADVVRVWDGPAPPDLSFLHSR